MSISAKDKSILKQLNKQVDDMSKMIQEIEKKEQKNKKEKKK